MTGESPDDAARRNRRARFYWPVQIGAWTAYSVIGFFAASSRYQGSRTDLAAGYACYAVYSIALTDSLRREIRRRGWRTMRPGKMWPRLLASVFAVSAVQTVLIVIVNLAFAGRQSPFVEDKIQIAFVFLGTSGAMAMWMIYYVMFTARWARDEQQAQLKLALREAQLRALEAQINPHFLFNGLNSIRGLVIENPARAQDMITRLSNILRHNLRHDVRHTVPLSSEIGAVTDYLALEGVRFDERLRVRFEVDPAAADVKVPSLLLQTLVENAVKHGIARLPAGGDVVIRASLLAHSVVVEVENSGGLTEAAPEATQVGLANTRERLRILYGGRATLSLAARGVGRVAATAIIPVTATT